jgi:hypothetical protein
MKESEDLADLNLDVTQILKQILEVFNRRVSINVSASEHGQEVGSPEHVNGSSYSIKREDFID